MKNPIRNKSLLGLVAAMLLTCANSFAQYTDRKAFNLNGNVKSVVCKNEGCVYDGPIYYSTITFTRAGKVSTLDGQPLPTDEMEYLKRNAKGQLSSFVQFGMSGETVSSYTYNAQGKITMRKVMFTSYRTGKTTNDGTTYFTYDADGNLIKEGATVYTILKKDSHGNWLSRSYKSSDPYNEDKIVTVTESRTIIYYQ